MSGALFARRLCPLVLLLLSGTWAWPTEDSWPDYRKWHPRHHEAGQVPDHRFSRTLLSSRRFSRLARGQDGRLHEVAQEVRDEVEGDGPSHLRGSRHAVVCVDGRCVQGSTPVTGLELSPDVPDDTPPGQAVALGDFPDFQDGDEEELPAFRAFPEFQEAEKEDEHQEPLSGVVQKALDRVRAAVASGKEDSLAFPLDGGEVTSVRNVYSYSRKADGTVEVNATETRCINGNCTTLTHSGVNRTDVAEPVATRIKQGAESKNRDNPSSHPAVEVTSRLQIPSVRASEI